MRRHPKAPSAGSILGAGYRRALLGRAFATRADSSDVSGIGAPSARLLFAFAIACVAVLLLVPAAEAGKVPGFGVLGTGTTGAGAGQLSGIQGVAVNTATTGANAGNVYVSDATNNRISEFTSTGTFVRAFGQDVVSSGPDNANEVQRVAVNATAGTFRLTFGTTGTKTTGATGTGTLAESSTTVENLVTSTGAFLQGEAITGAGISAGTTIVSVGAGTLTLSQAATASGTGVALTADLPFNASASLVQSALNALTTVSTGGGSVAVSGGPGDGTGSSPYVVTFNGGPLKGTDVAQMTAANGFLALSGGSGAGANEAKVTTSNAGATGYEICNVEANPTDVCKAGTSSSLAGGIAGGQGIGVDPATGNVFLASNTSKRINVYSGNGQFEGAFGWKVNAASPEEKLQFCTFVTGCAAGSSGGGAGEFNTLTGELEGAEPAIDPTNGDVIVPDPTNRRINVFGLTLNGSKEVIGVSFLRAFGGDVTPTINEKQTVTVSGATGGSFQLTFSGSTTGASGNGELQAGSKEITGLVVNAGKFVVGEEITGSGIPSGTTVTAVTFDSLTLSSAATTSAPAASFEANLPFNSSAAVLQAALQGLSSIGSGNAGVTGSGPWTVELKGALAGVNQPQITASGAALTGTSPSVTVTTVQDGANGTSTELETCTVATTCQAGSGNGLNGTFDTKTPTSIAVDSTGAIYATGQKNGASCRCNVQKFNAAGTAVEEFAPEQLSAIETGSPVSVASRFVSVDPTNDRVTVVKKVGEHEVKLYEFSRTGSFLGATPVGEAGFNIGTGTSGGLGFAVGNNERAYLARNTVPSAVLILGVPPAPSASVEPVSEIGGDTATFNGVARPSAPGSEGGFPTVAYFEYSTDGIVWSKTREVEIGNGTGSGSPNSCPLGNPPVCDVSQTVHGLTPGGNYLVRLVVSNGTSSTSATASFTSASAAPTLERIGTHAVEQSTATLSGYINPNNKSTVYHFEWGPTSSYGQRVPADFDAVAGSGGQPVKVSASLAGLQPATAYHFRIVASSSAGETVGPDVEFMTLNGHDLPFNRAPELVSPENKRPVGTYGTVRATQLLFQASESGGAVEYMLLNGLESSTAGGEVAYEARRGSTGWESAQVSPPSLVSPPKAEGLGSVAPGEVNYFSPNFTCGLLETFNPLTEDAPSGEVTNLYRWNPSSHDYTLISNLPPLNPTVASSGGHFYAVAGATPDCSRIFFKSPYSFFPGASGLYEWREGTLHDAGLRPDGSAAPNAGTTAGGEKSKNTVSDDGPLAGSLFFMATSDQGADSGKQAVFVRKPDGTVVDASQPTTATPTLGAEYETASPDGSNVFFTANYGLSSPASVGPAASCTNLTQIATRACALYDYDVKTGALREISLDTNSADTNGPAVSGVFDVSEDGSTVYFGAQGQLVPGEGRTYIENTSGQGFANVYRWHEGSLSYVGAVTLKDMNFSLTGQGNDLIHNGAVWNSQTTKNGNYLLFISKDDITGENSTGVTEAYLYSAESEETVCVSCPGIGKEPLPESAEAATNPVIQHSTGGIENYTPRSLTEDGRVFFTVQDALAPGAVAGKGGSFGNLENNIYEWHDGQVSLLASGNVHLRDVAGPHGEDVYVTTNEQLDPRDVDTATDVYDLRASGGFPLPASPPAACDPALDQCQGATTPAPQPPAPSTPSFVGAGNPAVNRHKPKKHKTKRHSHRNKGRGKGGSHHGQDKAGRSANNKRGGAK